MTTIAERRAGILRAEAILAEAPRSLTVGHLLAALAEFGPVRVTYTPTSTGRRHYELVAVDASEDDRFLMDPTMRLKMQTAKAIETKRASRADNLRSVAELTANGLSIGQIASRLKISARYVSELRREARARP